MQRPALAIASLTACLLLPACFSSRRSADLDRNPTVDTGVGAAIIMPGQSVPMVRPGAAPGGTQQTRVGPEGTSSSSTGSAQPSTGNLSMIGGSSIDQNRHEVGKEDPLVVKWLTAPFAVLAAPFVWAVEQARGEPEPGPDVPRPSQQAAPPPAPPPTDFETQSLKRMEAELARRGSGPAQDTSSGQPGASPPSIADELAALQRAPRSEAPAPLAPAPPPQQEATGEADGIVDRDGDGRIDEWIYRENGHIVRRSLDRDADGRVDRTVHYDPGSDEVSLVEEDENRDGRPDTWTEYRGGQVVRRRADADGDGQVDTWAFYADGRMTRHEQDTTGDGFRDRVGFYVGGQLSREEYDRDGDGRVDIITYYDAHEQVTRREEDVDRDGQVDVISHYEDGRLARKELLGGGGRATR